MVTKNPFQQEYLQQEVDFLYPTLPEDKSAGDVHFKVREQIPYQARDYLNNNWSEQAHKVPFLVAGETLWMSMTRMEVQSMWIPIQRSEGRVVAASGLGLGYFVLRAAEVAKHVTVYETNRDVIALFKEMHGWRDLSKITIVEEDYYNIRNINCDYFFADHYAKMCETGTLQDAQWFLKNNKDCKGYSFWTQERFLLEAMNSGIVSNKELLYYPKTHQLLKYWVEEKLHEQYEELLFDDELAEVRELFNKHKGVLFE